MIVCPFCRHEELIGSLYCSECGAELFYLEVSPPKTVLYENENRPGSGPTPGVAVGPAATTTAAPATLLVSLKILETGQIIPLEGSDEFTLGRISGNQPILPDIDLTPYKAYEGGVSRLHATLKIHADQITITDLGSANGTRINGKKIAAHRACLINHEDILSLGKFKVQLLIQKT